MSLMTANLSSQIPTVLFMLGIICFIGILGNILVIIVYALKHDRLTATLFILVLAISDFLACVTLIPGTMIIEYLEWNIDSTFLCKFYYFINNSFIPFSSLLISCIAFDRYFCLCHPFKNILTRECAKRVIFSLICICLLLGFSSTFTVRVERSRPEQDAVHDYKNDNSNNNVDDGGNITFMQNSNNNNNNNNNNNSTTTMTTLYLLTSYSNISIDLSNPIPIGGGGEKYECTEITRLNHTMIEDVLYKIVQKFQTCSYILCIICVVTLYVLIYRSVSKVFKKRLELKGVKMNEKAPKQTSLKSSRPKVNHHTNALNNSNANNTRHNLTRNFTTSFMNKRKYSKANADHLIPTKSRSVSQIFTDSNKPLDLSPSLQTTKSYHCQSYKGNEIHSCDEQPSTLETLQQYEVGQQQNDHSQEEGVEPHQQQQQQLPPDSESKKSNTIITPNNNNNNNVNHQKKPFKALINKLTSSDSTQSFSPNCDINHVSTTTPTTAAAASSEDRSRRSLKAIRDNIAFQNLKTAAMLFVVAVVYIVTFIPAMLMAIQCIPLYLPIFYLYYINNAINPIIYGFMNQNFRNDIRVLICQRLKCLNF